MKNYNKFISEQRELLEQTIGKNPTTAMATKVTGIGRGEDAADVILPHGVDGLNRNFQTAYDMKNIMKGLPSVTGIDYSEKELAELINSMNTHQQVQLRQQINTAQNFHDPRNIENMRTSLTRADIDRNNNTMFTPARGYAN